MITSRHPSLVFVAHEILTLCSAIIILLVELIMRPSEAQALGSTLSNLLSQKPKDARYARLQTDEVPPAHGASVQISGRRGPSCCKRCAAFLVVCLLLSALTGSVLYAIGSNTYRVQVQITAGNVITYEFDHKVTINASRVTTRRMSGLVTFWAVNKTERDSWLHMGFSPSPTESSVKPLYLFALKVKTKDEYGDKSTDENYELFSDGKVDGDLAYHIHCLLRQLLPVVKMKLYKVFLSRLRTSYDQVIKVHSPFFPGQTELHQSVSSTHQHVTISNRASSHNFLGFSNGKRAASQAQVAWDFHFNERTVLSKETGMAVDGGLNLTARVPLGEGDRRVSDSGVAHLVVKFDSAVKLRQHDGREVKQGSGFRNAHWASVPFPKPFGSPQVTYFRPQKNQSTAVQELLDNSARLITEGPRRFGNLPAMLSLRYTDEDEEDSEDGDSDGSDFDDGRVEWQTVPPPPPPVPDFGFEDRRKRSLRHRKTHPAVKVRNSRRRKTEISKSDLRTVWDELSASTLPSYPKRSMGVVRTSLFGMPVLGRVEYQVKEMEGDDDDDEDVDDDGDEDYDDQEEDSQWSALVSFYLELGPYRLTAFEGVHTLKNITSEVLRGSGRRIARRDWIEAVGDLVSSTLGRGRGRGGGGGRRGGGRGGREGP